MFFNLLIRQIENKNTPASNDFEHERNEIFSYCALYSCIAFSSREFYDAK
jgi:hypothetical protein